MRIFTTLLATALLGVGASAYGQVAFSEDFEGVTTPALPASWDTKTSDFNGIGWKTHSGTVTFSGSGTDWAIPDKSKYALLNDWAANTADTNNPARLITPLIDMSSLVKPHLFMEYYFVSARVSSGATETLIIEASLDTGKTWTSIKSVTAGNPYNWQKLYIDLTAYLNEDGIMFAVTYSDKGTRIIGAAVDNIKVFDPPAKDIELITALPVLGAPVNYGVAGTNRTLSAIVYNHGTDPITSVTANFQEGSSPVVTGTVSGLNIAPFTADTFNLPNPFVFPTTLGDYNITMWMELTGDITNGNDSGKTAMTSVSYMPKKKILAEEPTGTWCGWCPRGHVFMDSVSASPIAESFSLVAVHNADPMVVSHYDQSLNTVFSGYPSLVVDRRQDLDPSDLFDVYAEQKDYFGFADITLTEVPVGGFNYSVKASVKPAIDLNGDYRLAMAITEDDVTGTGSGWAQVNYYSNYAPLIGAGLNWMTEPNPVPAEKMHYNHVARGIFPSYSGAAGSLPAAMTAGTTYDYTFNVSMQPWWHRYKSMHAVVMLIRNSDGHVLNSNNVKVSVGVNDVKAGIEEMTIYPNPAANQAAINFSQLNAGDIDIIVTDIMGRAVQTISKAGFAAGEHKINLDLSAMAAGVYNVTVQTETGSVTARLSVVK